MIVKKVAVSATILQGEFKALVFSLDGFCPFSVENCSDADPPFLFIYPEETPLELMLSVL